MDIINRISELLLHTGRTQKDLCLYLNMSTSAFTEWKAGRNKSYIKRLPDIADFFGMTKEQLLAGEDPEIKKPEIIETSGKDPLLPAFLAIWQNLSTIAKQDILTYAIQRAIEPDEINKNN